MIILKTLGGIVKLRRSNELVAKILQELKAKAKPGVNTLYLNRVTNKIITERKATPGFLNYRGYPYSICASRNDAVVHDFPDETPLKDGDILTIDLGVMIGGYYGDAAITFAIGRPKKADETLIKVTEECLYLGIGQAIAGNRLGDVSYAIQKHAERFGYGLVRKYGGHGIGMMMHEHPHIPNIGEPHEGLLLKAGMTLAIEPMLTVGDPDVYTGSNGWTVKTCDGSKAAHFEHSIAIMREGPIILSKLEDSRHGYKNNKKSRSSS